MQYNTVFRLSTLALTCGAALLAFNQTAQASGFAVPESNATGMALSNAMVANADSLGAIPYNAAAMSFHEGASLSLGLLMSKPKLSVDTGSGGIDSDSDDIQAIPVISAHKKLTETWAVGISVSAPFGLISEWPAGTFDAQHPSPVMNPDYPATSSDPFLATSTIPTQSELEIVAFSPNLAYQLNENTSISVGIEYYWLRTVVLNGVVKTEPYAPNPSANIEGDGRGVGYSLGLLLKQGNWSFGGNFHSSASIPIDGTASLPAGTLPSFMSDDVHSNLKLPWRLQLGVRHQTTDKLAIEFDVTRTGWSTFNKFVIDQNQYGVNIETNHNEWNDANAFRLGAAASYDISPSTQLRVGYTFDETPQGDKYYTPRTPDADRHLYSIGIGHTLSKGLTLNAGYMYVKFNKRTIDSSRIAVAGSETNGTDAVNGTYHSSIHLFCLGVTKQFM